MKTGAHPKADTRNLHPIANVAESKLQSKFEALLPLLASPHDGEVVATARALGRVMERAGMDWHDIVLAVQLAIEDAEAFTPATPEPSELLTVAQWLHDNAIDRLFGNQVPFIENMVAALGAGRSITAGQEKYLRDLFATHHGEVEQ